MNIPARLHAKYNNLSDTDKKRVHLGLSLLGLFFLYFFLHYCYEFWWGPVKHPSPPLLIRQGNEIQIPAGSPLRDELKIQPVAVSAKPHVVSFPGMVMADPSLTVNLLPPLAGRLMRMQVRLGDYVKKNQIVAAIRSSDLATAYADKAATASRLELTTRVFKRAKEVHQVGGNSLQEVQQTENDFLQAKADAKRAVARLKLFGKNKFSILNIRAPMDGQVTAINYGTGTFINDPTTVLMTLVNVKKVWVSANIPESLIGSVKKDQPVEVVMPAYPKRILHGKINVINNVMDAETRTTQARIDLDNEHGILLPNMFATVFVKIAQPEQVMIPISSVLMQNETTSVFVETSPWRCERRDVQLGAEDGDDVRVLSGLKTGDRVVVSGGVFINDK